MAVLRQIDRGLWLLVANGKLVPFRTDGGLYLALDIADSFLAGSEELREAPGWQPKPDGSYEKEC